MILAARVGFACSICSFLPVSLKLCLASLFLSGLFLGSGCPFLFLPPPHAELPPVTCTAGRIAAVGYRCFHYKCCLPGLLTKSCTFVWAWNLLQESLRPRPVYSLITVSSATFPVEKLSSGWAQMCLVPVFVLQGWGLLTSALLSPHPAHSGSDQTGSVVGSSGRPRCT